MKKILAASLMMAFVLTGCNTVKGMGKDVSKAGDAVTNTAEKTSDEIRQNQFFPKCSQNPISDRVFLYQSFTFKPIFAYYRTEKTIDC